MRNSDLHREEALKTLSAKSLAEMDRLETATGARYTPFFRLPYYKAVEMVVIDPMHNLFLGTAKHVFKTWIATGKIRNLEEISEKLASLQVPDTYGRAPGKVLKVEDLEHWTADQLKAWTLSFSLGILKNQLPATDYACWSLFVQACLLLTPYTISKNDLERGDQLLLEFFQTAQELYGTDWVTPNLHLHLHMKDCILNYGPMAGFWLFGFERFNGMLGDFPNSHRSVEVEILRKFSIGTTAQGMIHDADMAPYLEVLQKVKERTVAGTLSETSQTGAIRVFESY